ncbi:MAG: hypothetical protein OXB88_05865 [Bacteriovoracales bacterium]|nr:hypothetical protein [Bacteriovoracales bacterium]
MGKKEEEWFWDRPLEIVTARTSSKNCNKGKVTVLHPDKIAEGGSSY